MKVYILVDSEGEACVTREPSRGTVYGTFQADYNRRRATAEASAAIEGARQAGATEILLHDAGFIRGATPPGLTLYYDDLPRGIKIALGGVPIDSAVDSTFDAAFLIGHHAMAGVQDGVMAHTFSSVTIKDYWLNGKRIGEIALEALKIGTFGVPAVMVSADQAGCREAAEWLSPVELAPTKQGISTHAAISLHPADACDLICTKAAAGLKRLADFRPFTIPGPYELRVDCHTEEQARNRAAQKPSRQFVPPSSYIIRTDNPLDL